MVSLGSRVFRMAWTYVPGTLVGRLEGILSLMHPHMVVSEWSGLFVPLPSLRLSIQEKRSRRCLSHRHGLTVTSATKSSFKIREP